MQDKKDEIISEEDLLIQQEFDALINDYLNTNHRKKVEIITKAFNFANAAHKGFKRRSGEPYIMHPLAVARIVVKEIGLGSTSICSALLHDVVEDTDYTVEDIENLFGPKIAQIVDGLTKISGGVFGDRASDQAENFRKLILTMSEDVRVIIIKIADRLHNMRTLGSMPPAKQYKIAGETQYIYAPLAHRLGLFRIKTELENLSFKYEHPEVYRELEEKLANDAENRKRFYEEFSKPIDEKFHDMGYKFKLKARIKTVYSIWRKMSTRNIPFEEVYDILALRVIFEPKAGSREQEQCWQLYSALTAIYKPHPERIRDWVSTPKANGYEALHVTVMGPSGRWVEVQIRSKRMDDIAERGVAAHWKYKTGETEESGLDKWLHEIKEILKNPEPNAIDFMETFKLNLFASEIFVFTPKGDIKTIALGATALDFAFLLHSDLGFHCIGAKVNHKLVPLSYKLSSGDQVEILTSKKQRPQPEWENYVSTAHAKSKIREWLKKENKSIAKKGKERIKEILENLNLEINNTNIVRLLNHYNIIDPQDLYLQTGKEVLNLNDIPKLFKPKNKNILTRYLKILGGQNEPDYKTEIDLKNQGQLMLVPAERVDRKKTFILTDDKRGYELASCCHPIPGDDVLGYVNDSEIVMIHKMQCPVAAKLKASQGGRIISAKWDMHKLLSFEEIIEVKGIDKKGIFVQILKVISESYNVNISKINIGTNDGIFLGRFHIFVHDTQDIENLKRDILKLPEIKSVSRIET
ncbi:bifunctional (p)ppGpp synthetase/guanosine-3',5'-bis(diphosphate) 3'-pyrophosphohydrolase [Paludibacter sp. 221]|uniref:RelA/SpoT family protein n=1 Tax=Paludibacter sp. 221 TaxID=2302939 RepID=UPI0013D642D0|nr:RelA/SpoT family protein [Paludibacter sp. 221]NDV47874.1 bifunctional (p)ppGpp synthetase/guanosine-3',5'-bis(diphosphate) 3'-pyrophosphohydrolase [Paludibacter sp. 221]